MKKYFKLKDLLYFLLSTISFASLFYFMNLLQFRFKLTHIFAKGLLVCLVIVFFTVVLINVLVKKKAIGVILKTVLTLLFSYTVSLYYAQDAMVYMGHYVEDMVYTQSEYDEGYNALAEDENITPVTLYNGNTKLSGWIKNSQNPDAPILIVYNGNCAFAGMTMDMYTSISDEINIVLFDYRGYGKSEGVPNQNNILEDTEIIYDYILKTYPQKDIYVLGYSIGTASASHIAKVRETAGVVLVAPFSSLTDVCNQSVNIFHGPLKLLVKYKYSPMDNVKYTDEKILIICSEKDEMFSPKMAESILDNAQGNAKLYTLTDSDHNGYFGEEFREITGGYIVDFIFND